MDELKVSLAGRIGGSFLIDASFTAPMAGITGLFGPSGSGKTTVLRGIAGLNRRLRARISAGDAIWHDETTFVPPRERGVGLVFQEGALFPHLTVRGNLDYARRRAPAGVVGFEAVVDMLNLASLLDRATPDLSGGERQRTAIARALLAQPRLLLLDEPVSALDRGARDEVIAAIETLSRHLRLPMVYVSHDLTEMARIADHLILIDQGEIIATGPTAELLVDQNLPLAKSPRALSVLSATVAGYHARDSLVHLAIDDHIWLVPAACAPRRADYRLLVMASDVGLSRTAPGDTTILNMPLGRVAGASDLPGTGQVNVLVRLGPDGLGQPVLARISRKSWDSLEFRAGECVRLLIKGVGLVDAE